MLAARQQNVGNTFPTDAAVHSVIELLPHGDRLTLDPRRQLQHFSLGLIDCRILILTRGTNHFVAF